MIARAVHHIILTVYTMDLLVICEALKAAAKRGVRVEVVADRGHTLTGSTVAMVERMIACSRSPSSTDERCVWKLRHST